MRLCWLAPKKWPLCSGLEGEKTQPSRRVELKEEGAPEVCQGFFGLAQTQNLAERALLVTKDFLVPSHRLGLR